MKAGGKRTSRSSSDMPEDNVAIVGLRFGKEFIPIYQHHPNTNMYAICQRRKESFPSRRNLK